MCVLLQPECLIAVWVIADTLHRAALCYIPLHGPTTLLICVLIVRDAIMEIWMVCMTPISAAGGRRRPLKSTLWHPELAPFLFFFFLFCGLYWLLKKKKKKSPPSATQLRKETTQQSPLLWAPSRALFSSTHSVRVFFVLFFLKLNLSALWAIMEVMSSSLLSGLHRLHTWTHMHARTHTHTHTHGACLSCKFLNNSGGPSAITYAQQTHLHAQESFYRQIGHNWKYETFTCLTYLMNNYHDTKTPTRCQKTNKQTKNPHLCLVCFRQSGNRKLKLNLKMTKSLRNLYKYLDN